MNRDQIRKFDKYAIEQIGVPGTVLMENAGRGCTEIIMEFLPECRENCSALVICGTGNNGGDGYVISRHLLNRGFSVDILVAGRLEKIKGDALVNLNILKNMGVKIHHISPASPETDFVISKFAGRADVLVDAIFGTGLTGQVRQDYASLIYSINKQDCTVAAVDIPSGLDCDTGRPLGAAVKAGFTVTFAAMKKGLKQPEAAEYTGDVRVVSIGIDPVSNTDGKSED